MLTLTLLGTGSAHTVGARDNQSALLTLGGRHILIDASGSPDLKLRQQGVDPLDLELLFITHRHPDHTYGVPSLLQQRRLARLKDPSVQPLRLFCQIDTLNVIKPLLEAHEVLSPDEAPIVRFETIPNLSIGHTVTMDFWQDWTAKLIGGAHKDVPVLNIVLQHPSGAKVIYATDTEPTHTLLAHAKDADVLCHDCQTATIATNAPGHANAEILAQKFDELGWPKKFVPIHLSGTPETDQDILRVLRDAAPNGVRIQLAEDGDDVLDLRAERTE